MFRRHLAVRAIKAGDLEGLKKILEKEPNIVGQNKMLGWSGNYYKTGILHIAAYCNQPHIVRFLVVDKNMDINKTFYNGCSALNYAARSPNSMEAIRTLLELGADPCIVNAVGQAPYVICKDPAAKKVLEDAYEERIYKSAQEKHEKNKQFFHNEQQQPVEERDTAVREKGLWTTSGQPREFIFERDMPEQGLRLTEIYNLAAEECTLIARDIQTGNLAQPVIRSFDEIRDQTKIKKAKELDAETGTARIRPTLIKRALN